MGNRASGASLSLELDPAQDMKNLKIHLSEEDYLPMPLALKRALVEGRRFHHIAPSRVVETTKREAVKLDDDERQVEEPVLTVITALVESRSRDSRRTPEEHPMVTEDSTNRNHSLLDMKLKKSNFTLELEERLRKSKLELGFDVELFDWKEYSYKTEKLDGGKRSESALREESTFSVHDCQILGLCSVRRPSLEPSVFKDEMSRKHLLRDPKAEDCGCDLCTLAFLTDSPAECEGAGDGLRPIVHRDSTDKTSTKSAPACGNASRSNVSTATSDQDITNLKIKRMFQKNKSNVMWDIHRNTNKTYNDVSIVRLTTCEQYKTECARARVVHGRQESSSTTLSASSLSTVLSYERVRKIFQTIIEKNHSRKRTKRNIHKFREMEELGLGEVKNNRWYPSDSKTMSIWNGLHSSMQGVQAQFRKYPKSHCKHWSLK